MKKQNGILIFLFCLTLFLTSFIYGYKMMGNKGDNKPLTTNDDLNENDLEILRENDKISPNTFVEKTIYYSLCNHTITELDNADSEIINMTEKQYRKYIEENYSNIKVTSFSVKEITLREERNHLCQNHYIIGESEGNIAIYSIDDNGKRVLEKVFDSYSISLLKEVDQQRLIDGIIVDSEEELSNVLENFIS